jgi:hypothetical protein
LLDWGEIGDGLLCAVVEDFEIFAAEVLDYAAAGVGDSYGNVNAIYGYADWGRLRLGGVLDLSERRCDCKGQKESER